MVPDVLRKLGLRGAIASAPARLIEPALMLAMILAMMLALALTVPAAAQMQSEGYKFLEAVKDREGTKATDMLNQPGNRLIDTPDLSSGDTGLHIVVARSDVLWIRFLLQRGADPNIPNKKSVTPLQLAASLGFTEGVEELLKGGANVNITDKTGETPLITAVHARNVALVRLLLAKSADPDFTDNSGRSARDHMLLIGSGNSLLKLEFDAADKKRAAAGTKKDYGPSL